MLGRCRHLWIAEDHERLGDRQPDAALLAGLWNGESFERRMIANRVRRVTMRHLPHELAAIEVDCGEHSVRRLDERETLNRQAAATAAGGRRGAACRGCRRGRWWSRRLSGDRGETRIRLADFRRVGR